MSSGNISEFTSLNEEQQAALIRAADEAVAARARQQEEAERLEFERVATALEADVESQRVTTAQATIKELEDRIAQLQLGLTSGIDPDVALSASKKDGVPDIPESNAVVLLDLGFVQISSQKILAIAAIVLLTVYNFRDINRVHGYKTFLLYPKS